MIRNRLTLINPRRRSKLLRFSDHPRAFAEIEGGPDPRIFGTNFGEGRGPYASEDVVKLLEIGMQTNPLS